MAEIESENLKLRNREDESAQRTEGKTRREKETFGWDVNIDTRSIEPLHPPPPLETVQHEKVWLALSFLIGKLSLRLRRRVGEAGTTGRNSISTEAAQFSRKFFMLSPNYPGVYPLNRPPPLARPSLPYVWIFRLLSHCLACSMSRESGQSGPAESWHCNFLLRRE